jgi:trans-aconitate methyltransferase
MDGHLLPPGLRRGVSNAAIHWMKQPERVVEGVANCLKPGAAVCRRVRRQGQRGKIRAALHGALHNRDIDPQVDPWYYASPEKYTELLERFGLVVDFIELIPRPTKLPGDLSDWLEVFAQPFSQAVRTSERKEFLQEVRRELEPILRDAQGNWFADYVRLRFHATKAS